MESSESAAEPQEVVVGFDGTTESEDALALGRRLAQSIGGRLVVANVYFVPRELDPARMTAHEDDERDRSNGMLTSAAALVDYDKVEYVSIGSSSAARGLHDLGEKRDAVALVVGSTERGELGVVAPGSIGRRLLSGAPCAVAIASKGVAGRPSVLSAIGVAFDGSESSEDALDGAIRLAPRVDAHIDVLGVVRWAAELRGEDSVVAGDMHVHDELRGELEQRCQKAMQTIPDALRGSVRVAVGHPASVLEEESAQLDLLVCGSRSHGRIHQVLLGSVSGQLVDRARCSVLVVPRGGRRVDQSRIG
jgi:nucleotide-binding universal stress UspA family protein